MARQVIDTTTNNGSYIGDPAKVAFNKVNDNFAELYGSAGLNNLLINPSILINQRVFAGGALAANAFGYDRWFAGASGANVAVSTAGVITHTSGSHCQVIEAPSSLLGKTVAISVGDLSGGNLTVSAAGVSGVITPGTGRRSVNLLLPSTTGTGNVLVVLTGAGVTYREVMVLRADQPGRFDARLAGVELSLAQRYFEKSYNQSIAPGSASALGRVGEFIGVDRTRGNALMVAMSVRKRAAPAVTIYASETGAAGNISQDNGANLAIGSVSSQGDHAFQVTWTNTAGRYGASFHWAADAEVRS